MMFGLPWWLAFFIAAVPAALLKSSMLEEARERKSSTGRSETGGIKHRPLVQLGAA
jgi:hypothetical protein